MTASAARQYEIADQTLTDALIGATGFLAVLAFGLFAMSYPVVALGTVLGALAVIAGGRIRRGLAAYSRPSNRDLTADSRGLLGSRSPK